MAAATQCCRWTSVPTTRCRRSRYICWDLREPGKTDISVDRRLCWFIWIDTRWKIQWLLIFFLSKSAWFFIDSDRHRTPVVHMLQKAALINISLLWWSRHILHWRSTLSQAFMASRFVQLVFHIRYRSAAVQQYHWTWCLWNCSVNMQFQVNISM